MMWILLLVAWLLVSLPVGVFVGRVLRASAECRAIGATESREQEGKGMSLIIDALPVATCSQPAHGGEA